MDKVVHTDYVDKPEHPGAYWMFDRAKRIYIICNVVFSEGKFYLTVPGKEGGVALDDLCQAGNRWTFWGPLSLPTGTARIGANAVYEEIETPVEPQDAEG